MALAQPNTSLERTPRSRPNRRKAPWSEQLRGAAAQLAAVGQQPWGVANVALNGAANPLDREAMQ